MAPIGNASGASVMRSTSSKRTAAATVPGDSIVLMEPASEASSSSPSAAAAARPGPFARSNVKWWALGLLGVLLIAAGAGVWGAERSGGQGAVANRLAAAGIAAPANLEAVDPPQTVAPVVSTTPAGPAAGVPKPTTPTTPAPITPAAKPPTPAAKPPTPAAKPTEGGPPRFAVSAADMAAPASMDYSLHKVLGDTFLFYEAQRSGKISAAPGGNRIKWRGDNLVDDGSAIGADLEGGHYEAGNRLKVTLASAYATARLAHNCAHLRDVYAAVPYDGASMLHWCKREVRWGAEYLLKAHQYAGAARTSTWGPDDQLVIQVGAVPSDWSCYRRAERLPGACPGVPRTVEVADAAKPAADVAGEAAAALAAAAVLLQGDDAAFASDAMTAAAALLDFGTRFPGASTAWSEQAQKTYPTSGFESHLLYGSAMLSWATNCADALPTCDAAASDAYAVQAAQHWATPAVEYKKAYMVSDWDNPVMDAALLLAQTGKGAPAELDAYRAPLLAYVDAYVRANGASISVSPKGLRRVEGQTWASLRVAAASSHLALSAANLPGADATAAAAARCYARSQIGYILGDTGFSYVVGHGARFPRQVHHRDAACTLAQDAAGKCAGAAKMFTANVPNPTVLVGAMVGGPDASDAFIDVRKEYEYTEVALDYNVGLTNALAGLSALPDAFWAADCAAHVPNYPWPARAAAA